MPEHFFLRRSVLPSLLLLALIAANGVAFADEGFNGFSIYSGSGYQGSSVRFTDLRVRGTNLSAPSYQRQNNGSFWLTGVNYTHVFANKLTIGLQAEYFPISQQYTLSLSPGYEFNDSLLGYLKAGWASVPTSVDQGPGRTSYQTNLSAIFAGFGVKVMLYRGVFAYGELTYAQLQTLKFTSWVGSIPISGKADTQAVNLVFGVGYRF